MNNIDLFDQIILENILHKWDKKLAIRGIWDYDDLEENLNHLCASYIFHFLISSNIVFEINKKYKVSEIKEKLNIAPLYDKFFDFFLLVLVEDRIIVHHGDEVQFLKTVEEVGNCNDIEMRLRRKYKEFKGLFDLLHHCYDNYSKALSGKLPSILVLFPFGKQDFMNECTQNTVEHSKERVLCKVLSIMIKKVMDRRKTQTIRIIEVGGGSARLTKEVAEVLEDMDIEYYFTDITPILFKKVEEKCLIKNTVYKTFDITKDPQEQGFELKSFDLVIGLNVVHATSSIKKSIQNISKLLVADGYLMLVEDVKKQRWIDMIWGLADGWWSFEDYDLRTNSPLISLEQWKVVLSELELGNIITLPQSREACHEFDCGLIAGRKTLL